MSDSTPPKKSPRAKILRKENVDVTTLRQCAIQGGFANDLLQEWQRPSFKMAVFLSSTFTDTQLERAFLMDKLLFDLRAIATKHGIQVIFGDMRWGILDASTHEHKTWFECLRIEGGERERERVKERE